MPIVCAKHPAPKAICDIFGEHVHRLVIDIHAGHPVTATAEMFSDDKLASSMAAILTRHVWIEEEELQSLLKDRELLKARLSEEVKP